MLGPASHTLHAQPPGKNLPNLTRLIEELSAQAWTRLPSYSIKKWQKGVREITVQHCSWHL